MVCSLFLSSCGLVRKNTSYSDTPRVHVEAEKNEPAIEKAITKSPVIIEDSQADAIVETALSFSGVRYKYGGTNRKGMDCSGLLYVSFLENDFPLPRTSHLLAEKGKPVKVSQVQKGDLLFFKTRGRGKKINHVGLVVAVDKDDIQFIHSTTSRGVIVSSLREGYWNYAFVKATRVL